MNHAGELGIPGSALRVQIVNSCVTCRTVEREERVVALLNSKEEAFETCDTDLA